MVTEAHQHEFRPSKNIQHDLELWDRIQQYDKRAAEEDITPVLTRKQKHKIKQVLEKQPPRTCARGDPPPSAQ